MARDKEVNINSCSRGKRSIIIRSISPMRYLKSTAQEQKWDHFAAPLEAHRRHNPGGALARSLRPQPRTRRLTNCLNETYSLSIRRWGKVFSAVNSAGAPLHSAAAKTRLLYSASRHTGAFSLHTNNTPQRNQGRFQSQTQVNVCPHARESIRSIPRSLGSIKCALRKTFGI